MLFFQIYIWSFINGLILSPSMEEKDKNIFSYILIFPFVWFIIGWILMLIIWSILGLVEGIPKERTDIYSAVISSIVLLIFSIVWKDSKEVKDNLQSIKPNYQISEQRKLENERIKREHDEKKKQEALMRRQKLIPEKYIKSFLFNAEKKYEKVDKYGNKNVGSLEKEIMDYLIMIAKQWGNRQDISSTEAYARGRSYPSLNEDYKWLVSYLRDEFQKYHSEKQRKLSSGMSNISQMTGVEFERYLANIFKSSWYTIEMTPESWDQWADIIAEKGQRKLVIQAKRYKWTVWNGSVQEVIGAIRYYEWTEWWVITNSLFTNSARELARVNNITLIDGVGLETLKDII